MKTRNIFQWDYLKMLPILIFIGIMPLAVRLKTVSMSQLQEDWLPTPFIYSDIFNYYKSRLIVAAAVMALVILLIGWMRREFLVKLNKMDWAALAFSVAVLISTVFSEHKSIALWGYAERWHGAFIWLSYVAMYFYMRFMLRGESEKRTTLRILLFSGLVMTGIGILQLMSLDPFRMNLIKSLIVPRAYADAYGLESVVFTFELNRVYLTLYNPNNVGLYTAAVLPFALMGFKYETSKIFRGLWVLLGVFSLLCMVGSYSRTGIVVTMCAFTLYGLMNLKQIRGHGKKIIVGVLILIITLVAGDAAGNGVLSRRMTEMLDVRVPYTKVESIEVQEKILAIEYNDEQLLFSYDPDSWGLRVTDRNGSELSAEQSDSGYFVFEDEDLIGLQYGVGNYQETGYYLAVKAQNKTWKFFMGDAGYRFINDYGKLIELETAPSMFFEGRERIGSNRGYIWSRTIPLIYDRPMIGAGPDSFALEFPQNDYVALMNVFGSTKDIVDKPHNQYLGLLVNFGLLGFTAFMAWTGMGFWKGRHSLPAVSLLCVLLSFVFYDISVGTGWLLVLSLGMVQND